MPENVQEVVWLTQEAYDKLQHELDRSFPPLNVKATITGYSAVGYQELDRAVEEILVGFLVAFGLIIVVETIMFRSLRVALISIVPNIAPICACFLLMRLLGLKLRVDNSLVLCISVGGLFNTTIHIVARVLQQLRSGAQDPDEIVGRALNAVGPPSLYTALILSLGFSAMALSRFPGLQVLGLLCLVTLLTGFVCDAFLTTSFLRLFYGWKEELPTASNSGSRRQAMTAGQ